MGDSFDYIVVGAGSSGCVVAARLSEDPDTSVLVIEAGGAADHLYLTMPLGFLKGMMDPRFNWNYWSQPEPHLGGRPMPLPRGRVLGGSGSINGMFAMRGHPLDYEQWAQMGARGWGYADVLPYFRKLETSWRGDSEFHGNSGPIEIQPITSPHLLHDVMMQTAANAGFPVSDDLAGAHPEGFARGEQSVDRRGRRSSGWTAYLKPALARPNLALRTKVLVRRLVFEGKRCIGVEVDTPGGPELITARREVIVAGGTYNSPHLLMLSGVGPAEHLAANGIAVVHDSPGVGRNLQEHPCASLEFDAAGPVTFLNQLRWDKIAWNAARWWATGRGTMATMVNSCNVVIRTAEHLDRPDLQIMVNPIRFDAAPWFPGIKAQQEHVFWAGVVQLHPESRGWVELAGPDPRAPAAITLNLLDAEADRVQLRRAFRATRAIYNTAPMSGLIARERTPGVDVDSDAELDAFIDASLYVAQHPVGTCAMAMGERSVVDSELRVIGVEGLRVADASVMPTVPGGNTNLSAYMVGEKAADLIKGQSLPRAELAA